MLYRLGAERSSRIAMKRRWIHARDLIYELVSRDIKLRYKRSFFGVLWSLLNPLAYLLVLTFLFRRVVPLDIPNYPLFAFTGVLSWSWFATSLSGAATSITGSREFIHQPAFPVAVLPAVPILSGLVHFLIALGLLLVVLAWSGSWLSGTVIALPCIIIVQFTVTLSLAYFLATLNVKYRDTAHVLSAALTLGFFLTPVFYRPRSVPESFQALYGLNPMLHLIQAYRDVLVQGSWPDASSLAWVAAATLLVLSISHRVFVRASHEFDQEL